MTLKERLQAANLGITVFDDINQSQISYSKLRNINKYI